MEKKFYEIPMAETTELEVPDVLCTSQTSSSTIEDYNEEIFEW